MAKRGSETCLEVIFLKGTIYIQDTYIYSTWSYMCNGLYQIGVVLKKYNAVMPRITPYFCWNMCLNSLMVFKSESSQYLKVITTIRGKFILNNSWPLKICRIFGGLFSMYILCLVQNYIVLLFYNNIEIGNLNDPKESTFHMPLKASV